MSKMVIEQAHEYRRPVEDTTSKGISPELKEVLHMLKAFEDDRTSKDDDTER